MMLTLLSLSVLVLTSNIQTATASESVGVKTGDWIKYEYIFSGEVPPGTSFPDWMKVEFLSVEGTTATVRMTLHFSDGTEQEQTVSGDIITGSEFSGFIIPANLTIGDSIYIGGYGYLTIAGETVRKYAGMERTVVYASMSMYGTELTYYWDKHTGVMLEASVSQSGITASAIAIETNMWQTQPVTSGTRICVKASKKTIEIGEETTVNVTVINMPPPGLYSYQLCIHYDNRFLTATSAQIPSDHFLKPGLSPSNIFIVDSGTINQTMGHVSFALTLLTTDESGKTGNGTLVTATFKGMAQGNSIIDLPSTDPSIDLILIDSDMEKIIDYTVEPESVTVGRIPSGEIVVNFDDIPCTIDEEENITNYAGISWDFNIPDFFGEQRGCWCVWKNPDYATPSSPPNYAYNGWGAINPGLNFTSLVYFKGAYFMKPDSGSNPSAVRFVGCVDDVQMYYSEWLALSITPTYLSADFSQVDRVVVEMQGAGWFAMDDVKYSLETTALWDFVFSDSYGRGTTLRINTESMLFQLITPDKDYGIRNATHMQTGSTIIVGEYYLLSGQGNILIVIGHEDNELSLTALALDKLGYCAVTADDRSAEKSYFLVDDVDTENQTRSIDLSLAVTSWLFEDAPMAQPLLMRQNWQSFMHVQYGPLRLRTKMIARALTVTVAYRTDLTKDFKVDIRDVSIVAAAYGVRQGDRNWNQVADLDKNCIVNIVDVSMVANDYGKAVFDAEFIKAC